MKTCALCGADAEKKHHYANIDFKQNGTRIRVVLCDACYKEITGGER